MRPGRDCPHDYGLGAAAFLAQPEIEADVLYIVGGLYGNTIALEELGRMFAAEPTPAKRMVFNGDFHWFDRDPGLFAEIERGTGAHARLRGNVETEIARTDPGAGCGCAYPEEVGDDAVERSNRILAVLRGAAGAHAAALGALPMVARARVGDCRVAITHGDERSLAGWRLARDRVGQSWRDGLAEALEMIGADLIASSHSCEPVASAFVHRGRRLAAINNGAAGMANFAGSPAGLLVRIARPAAGLPQSARAAYRTEVNGADVAAIEIPIDLGRWLPLFDRQWPEGSDAARSYRARIEHGTSLRAADFGMVQETGEEQ